MDEIAQKFAKRMEDAMFAAVCGPVRKQPQTALRLRGDRIETVQLDDAGNVIERCWKCGPVLLCSEHLALVI